ncbi:MAG: gamma-glutamyl-gamma-aminobutyrate hydrolase family protein [Kiritimatiellaeota bacterium]|nr:gamma-glutamyl-gamma-aminobutyrate hydrolase family protein [Kiritimatiellota bacterium]
MLWLATKTLVTYDVPASYDRWLRAVGITPQFVGPGEGLPDDLDAFAALLLTGGGDVDPALYGAPPHPRTGDISAPRDALEQQLITRFLEMGRPVFGICRGIQILSVACGGHLVQHVPDWMATEGRGADEGHSPASGDAVHAIRFAPGSLLDDALRGTTAVNSHHHQAVDPLHLGRGLRITAWSGAGVVEAVEGVDLPAPVLAVQWHPERMADGQAPAAQSLLRLLLSLAQASV